MKINNNAVLHKLSYKTLKAAKTRTRITILAIAMTSLLFTSMFTILYSLNTSYQNYTFRTIGGYAHGTFKNITENQKEKLSANPRIQSAGERILIGIHNKDAFAKEPAEINYMDENCAKWCYALPTSGRLPQNRDEIAMDQSALRLLGIKPEIGTKLRLSYHIENKSQVGENKSDEFTLVGFWEHDDLLPVHFIHISKEYVKQVEIEQKAKGITDFPIDLHVMLGSSFHIKGTMEAILEDLALSEDDIQIGVNWGYTTSSLENQMDIGSFFAIFLFISMVVLIGYFIIHNIFQISISNDIRFYGLLKTIGFTGRQLRKIILRQALILCGYGIPTGILLGYVVGGFLTPYILNQMQLQSAVSTLSGSYRIFLLSALFSLFTVLFSCLKPAKIAGKVSPIEATKFIEHDTLPKRKTQKTRGAKIYSMAIANLLRNKKKVVFVILSISLSLILLNLLFTLVNGFDMETYLSKKACADFILGHPDYFNYRGATENVISPEMMQSVQKNTDHSLSGCGYQSSSLGERVWVKENEWNALTSHLSAERKKELLHGQPHKEQFISTEILIEGLDSSLFDKVTVLQGNLDLVRNGNSSIALVIRTDDYGKPIIPDNYPPIGSNLTVEYILEAYYMDSRTGERVSPDTPDEFIEYKELSVNSVEYRVDAYITVPYAMGFRFFKLGYQAVLPVKVLEKDSRSVATPLFYLFDTPNHNAERRAENYLKSLCKNNPSLMYESKHILRQQFYQFKEMFTLIGCLLCLIIGFIGILNYFNSIMTSFLNRKKEFAILQAIGMTERQLKKLLMYEGGFYILASCFFSIVLSVLLHRPIQTMFEKTFWFFKGQFTIFSIWIVLPILLLIGIAFPYLIFHHLRTLSITSRIRE